MLLFSIFILHAISTSLCNNTELEGVTNVKQDDINTLSQHSEFSKKLPALQFASKRKLPKKALGEAVMRAVLEPNMTRKTNTTQITKPYSLQDYVDHLKKKGKKSLKYIGKLILRQMKLEKNITFMLKAITDDYVTMIQNYHDFVTQRQTEDTNVIKEFVYLDMVETSCRLLYSKERKLLNDIIKELNSTFLNDTVRIINEKIFKFIVNDKTNEIRYVCNTYKVCRKYPTFTDYFADLINEILKLPEEKFKKFLNILADVVASNDVFFSTLCEKEDRDAIALKLGTFSDDVHIMRDLFAVLRSVISHRFKIVRGVNENLNVRITAIRILLDIIDNTLNIDDDLLAMDFDTAVSALRNWSRGLRNSIDDIFEEFANHLLRLIEYNLTKYERKEISVLIKDIMRGTTSRNAFYQHMLMFGSRYNEDEFEPTVDLF